MPSCFFNFIGEMNADHASSVSALMMKIIFKLLSIIILTQSVFKVSAGEVYDQFPDHIDPNGQYVFYSHGYIVEGKDPTPKNPRWGVYDFPEIKESLADDDYYLIAPHRKKNTAPDEFASSLSAQAEVLIEKGVLPEAITFVGFSRGGYITILVSSYLKATDVNFVVLAGCGESINRAESIELSGHVLSMYETSDDLVGPCEALAKRSVGVSSFKEISISTGKEHGAFYQPIPEWVLPVKQWINRFNGIN